MLQRCSFCFSLGVSINLCPQRSNFSPSHPIIFPSAPWALGCSCPCQCNRPTVNVQIGCPARELSLWCSLYGDFDRPAAAVIPRKSPIAISSDLTLINMSFWRKLAEMSSRLAMSRVRRSTPWGALWSLTIDDLSSLWPKVFVVLATLNNIPQTEKGWLWPE